MKYPSVLRITKHLLCLISMAAIFASIAMTRPAFGAAGTGKCSANPQSRQLDYWLGDWTIGGPGASANATSKVSLTLDGCMVVEKWDGGRGHRGENVFAYSADDKSWHGMFVDNEGRVHIFTHGNVASGSAEFSGPSTGPDGNTVLNRVRIVRDGPDRVEQIWQKSSDNGVTWKTEFRGQYLRKKS